MAPATGTGQRPAQPSGTTRASASGEGPFAGVSEGHPFRGDLRRLPTVPSPADTPLHIRAERSGDRDGIRRVVAAAFSHHVEVADLVEALRASPCFLPDLSLVAVSEDGLIGHVLLTTAEVIDERAARNRVLVLSPLSVLPGKQRRGIGSSLVQQALAEADAGGHQMVVLQGSPQYYPRFGFRDSRSLGITMDLPDWAPAEAGMAHPLTAYDPAVRGHLRESQPFLDLVARTPAP